MLRKTALITGANGMDAKTLAFILLKKGYNVVFTHRRNSFLDLTAHKDIFKGVLNNANSLDYYICDLLDKYSIESCLKSVIHNYDNIDEVYLLGAMSHVGDSFKMPETSILTNGMSVFHFLNYIHTYLRDTRVYFAGTSELLGGANPPEGGYTENCPYDTKSPYSIGKELGTRWVKYFRDMGVYVCYGVLFNHSNCFRSKDFFIRRVSNMAARIALKKENKLKLGNLDFYRDEHWSDFGCEMMWKMLQLEEPEDFIIATGETHSGREYLDHAFSYFGLDWRDYVEFDESRTRPNEVNKLIGNSVKAQEKLGWNPKRMPFGKHIELMCEYDFKLEKGETPQIPNVLEKY